MFLLWFIDGKNVSRRWKEIDNWAEIFIKQPQNMQRLQQISLKNSSFLTHSHQSSRRWTSSKSPNCPLNLFSAKRLISGLNVKINYILSSVQPTHYLIVSAVCSLLILILSFSFLPKFWIIKSVEYLKSVCRPQPGIKCIILFLKSNF